AMSDARRAPRYTGVRTFAGLAQASLQAGPPLRAGPAAPGGEESPSAAARAVVVGVPFDTATSWRPGARFGPEAIRSASALLRPYHPVLEIDVLEAVSVVDYGDLPVAPGDTEGTYRRIEHGLAPLVDAGIFPLVFGGD